MNKFKVGEWVTRNDYLHGPTDPKFYSPIQITSVARYDEDAGLGPEYIRFWGQHSGWSVRAFKRCMPPNITFNPDDYL